MFSPVWSVLALCFAMILAGCGGGSAGQVTRALAMPPDVEKRHAAMDEFGRRLHAALRAGRPLAILLDDDQVRRLLESDAATRFAARRAAIGSRLGNGPRIASALAETRYLGVCLQDSRDSTPDEWGLRTAGWTFRRVLLVARRPGGRRVALWIDGVFVYTDRGFGALDLERMEDPRWEHSDLELAACDMATSLN
jgi:hypothetical protein